MGDLTEKYTTVRTHNLPVNKSVQNTYFLVKKYVDFLGMNIKRRSTNRWKFRRSFLLFLQRRGRTSLGLAWKKTTWMWKNIIQYASVILCLKNWENCFLKCYSTFFPFFCFLSPAPSLTIELNVSVTILCVVRNFMFGNPAV